MVQDIITVVITTYKRPTDILKRAIDSALNQTYKDKEIIVVNDCPEDTELTKEIKVLVACYEGKVNLYTLEKNSGACFARNFGLSKAKGKYIAFLDDDDYWLENKLEVQHNGFTNDKIGLVYTPFYRVDGKRKKIMCRCHKSGNMLEDMLYNNPMAMFPLMRADVVKEIGGFDVSLPSSQDHDLILRLALHTDFAYIDIPTAVYNVSEVSISTNIKKKTEGFDIFMEKHKKLYQQYPKPYCYQNLTMCNNMIAAGEMKQAYYYWKKSTTVDAWQFDNIIEPLKGVVKRIIGRKPFR